MGLLNLLNHFIFFCKVATTQGFLLVQVATFYRATARTAVASCIFLRLLPSLYFEWLLLQLLLGCGRKPAGGMDSRD